MCAECHSTGLRKNYDAKTDRFATTWAEISVGCETCHGQGSAHAAWARDQKSWWPFGKREDSSRGLLVRFDERRDVAWPIDPQTQTARRSRRAGALRKEVETCGLCHARRAGFHENWVPGQSLSQTHAGRSRSRAPPITPTARSATWKSPTTIRRSSRARCLPPASPAATATNRTARNFGSPATVSACSAMPPTNMPTRGIAITPAPIRRRPAYRATCRPAPIWSSIPGTITHFACRGPISRLSSERRMRATIATATNPRNGPPRQSSNGSAPGRKGLQTYGAAFHAARTEQPDAAALLAAVVADDNAPAVARATALGELAPLRFARQYRRGANWPCRSRSDGADRRARHAGERAGRSGLAAGVAAARRSRARRPDQGSLAARVGSNRKPAQARPASASTLRPGNSSPRNGPMPSGRKPAPRSANFLAQRGQTAEAEAEYKAALQLSPQYATAAINLADLYRQLGRDGEGENILRTRYRGFSARCSGASRPRPTLTRLKQSDDALAELRRAAELEPDRRATPMSMQSRCIRAAAAMRPWRC